MDKMQVRHRWKLSPLCLVAIFISLTKAAHEGLSYAAQYREAFPFSFVPPSGITYVCPTGWTRRGVTCYRFVPFTSTESHRYNMSGICYSIGGNVADVKDVDDALFLGDFALHENGSLNAESVWIDNHYFYAAGHPSNDDDCVALSLHPDTLYGAVTVDCDSRLPVICTTRACIQGEFRCANGKCINGSFVRDGENDCGDFSDEWNLASETCQMSHRVLPSPTSQLALTSTSPYPDNRTCTYILQGPAGHRIELQLTEISLERFFDTLKVYVGAPSIEGSHFVAHYTGVYTTAQLPPKILSYNNWMIVVLETDNLNIGISTRRFTATWRAEAISTYNPIILPVAKDPLVLKSPGFDSGKYPIFIDVFWDLVAPNTQDVITIKIDEIHLEEGDSLYISSSDLHITFDGPLTMVNVPDYFTTSHYQATIELNTFSTTSAKGFKFTYYTGCDISLPYNAAYINTPGQYEPSIDTDRIRVSSVKYPRLRSCTYTVATNLNVTLKSTTNAAFASGEEVTIIHGDVDAPTQIQIVNNEPVDERIEGDFEFIFESNIDTSTDIGIVAGYSPDCPAPAVAYTSGQITIGEYGNKYLDAFTVGCPAGQFFEEEEYEGLDSFNVTCLFGPVWNVARLPTCTAVFCGAIPSVLNSRITGAIPSNSSFQGAQVGNTVTYECVDGARALTSLMSTCMPNGSWVPEPVCSLGRCSSVPAAVVNGVLIWREGVNDSFEVGVVIQVICDNGYEQTAGLPYLVCHRNLSWNVDPNSIRCEPRACMVPAVTNAVATPSIIVEFGQVTRYQCNTGYKITGSHPIASAQAIECVYDESSDRVMLNATAPTCENRYECADGAASCATENALLTCIDTVGSYTCECIDGSKLNAGGTACEDINECTDGTHRCEHDCYNENITVSNLVKKYTCTCPSGFVLYNTTNRNGFGATVLYGEDGGKAPGSPRVLHHSCVRAVCPTPTLGQNGKFLIRRDKTNFYTSESIVFMCNLGFMVGADRRTIITCQNNGTWNDATPNCTRASCLSVQASGLYPNESDFRPALITPTDINMNVLFYTGTDTDGNVTAICNHTQANAPTTRLLYCMFDYTDDTYKLLGDSLDCSDTRVNCGVPSKPGMADFTGGDSTFKGHTFNFTCNDGEPTGKSSIGARTANNSADDKTVVCLHTGQWDFGSLLCPAGSCRDPRSPYDGTQMGTSYRDASIVTFDCNRNGFEPVPPALKCKASSTSGRYNWVAYENDTEGNVVNTTTNRPDCVDMEIPVFANCSGNLVYWVDKYYVIGDTRITDPVVTDNQGVKTLELGVTTRNLTLLDFNLKDPVTQDMILTWTATDFEPTNQAIYAQCVITVRVKATELVNVTRCPGPITLTLEEENGTVVINEANYNNTIAYYEHPLQIPIVTGLTPSTLSLNISHLYQVRIVESWAKYKYDTEFSEPAVCSVAVILKPNRCTRWYMERVRPLHSTIFFNDDDTVATITCNNRYTFRGQPGNGTRLTSLEYVCNMGETEYRNPSFLSYIPQCVATTAASFMVTFNVDYTGITFTTNVTNNLLSTIRSRIPQAISNISSQSDCPSSSISVNMTFAQQNASAERVTIRFTIMLQDTSNTFGASLENCRTYVEIFFVMLFGNRLPMLASIPLPGGNAVGAYVTNSAVPVTSCPVGENVQMVADASVVVNRCVPCPPGYMKLAEPNATCVLCPLGTYQNQAGQNGCITCPNGTRTFVEGAHSVNLCFGTCPAPTVNELTGMFPCNPCGQHTFWASATECFACAADTITRGPHGSPSGDGCLGKCDTGTRSGDGYGVATECIKCPKGYYTNETGSAECTRCGNGSSTTSTGNRGAGACVPVCATFNCGVHGTCAYSTSNQVYCQCAFGYEGDLCNIEIDFCAHDPCFYGGDCVIDLANQANGGYRCINCPQDFTMVEEIGNRGRSVLATPNDARNIVLAACQELCLADPSCQFIEHNGTQCLVYMVSFADDLGTLNRTGISLYVKTPTIAGPDCIGEPNDCESDEYTASPCQNRGECKDGVLSYTCLCPPTFSGNRCQTASSVCAQDPCDHGTCREVPTGATGVSAVHRYCECQAGYTGQNCDMDIDECLSDPCWYGTVCTNGINNYTCACNRSTLMQQLFSGSNCATRLSTNMCSQASCGTTNCCNDYENNAPLCFCPAGQTQDTYKTRWFSADTPGMNGASTVQSQGDYETKMEHQRILGAPVCSGQDMVSSVECRIVGEQNPISLPGNYTFVVDYACSNQGLWCNDTDNGGNCEDFEVQYTCQVSAGVCRDKNQCVEPDDITDFGGAMMPLQCDDSNSLSCTDASFGIRCNCTQGYTGYFCESPIDDCVTATRQPVCLNGATCADFQNEYMCTCVDGFQGDTCATNINECESNPCVNGNCTDRVNGYTCTCPTGWTGTLCDEDINACDSEPCRYGAACVDNSPGSAKAYNCTCRVPWMGQNCTQVQDFCTANTCQGNGRCYSLEAAPYCACSPGSEGEFCDDGQDICEYADPCANNGVCDTVDGEPMCVCPAEFAGDWCERTRDFCSETNNVCENGGTCTIVGDNYTCICAPGFTGVNCQTNINDCAGISCGSGGRCLDGVQISYCDCPYGLNGYTCGKATYRGYDYCLNGNPVTLFHAFELNSSDLSVSLWFRLADGANVESDMFQLSTASSELQSTSESMIMRVSASKIRFNAQGTTLSGTYDEIRFAEHLPVSLGDKQWHHIVVIYEKVQDKLQAFVDDSRLGSGMPVTTNNANDLSEYALVTLGSDRFEGCLSLVQVWGRAISEDNVTDIYGAGTVDITNQLQSGLALDWAWESYGVSAHSQRVATTRGMPVCERGKVIQGQSFNARCVMSQDKIPPTNDDCPSNGRSIPTGADPLDPYTVEVNIQEADMFTEDGDLVIRDKNILNGTKLSYGKHIVVYNAYDAAGNRATCTYPLYVPVSDCTATVPENALNCSYGEECSNLGNVCELVDVFVTLSEPIVRACDESGLFNFENPSVRQRIPHCSAKNDDVKVNIEISFTYTILSGRGLTSSQITIMEDVIKRALQRIVGLCTSNVCDTQLVVMINSSSNSASTVVTLTGVPHTVNESSVSDLLYQAVYLNKTFDNQALGGGVVVDTDTYNVEITYVCTHENEVAVTDPTTGDHVCAPCPPGAYFEAGACLLCEVGFYQEARGQTECTHCPIGKTTETYGSTFAAECYVSCDPGHFFDEVNGTCTPCEIANYQPEAGQSECLLCPAGFTTQAVGTVNRTQCQPLCEAGKELINEVCIFCDYGKYRGATSLGSCQPCPVDYNTTDVGSASEANCSVRLCDAGFYASYPDGEEPNCVACPVNTYSAARDSATECTRCGESERTDNNGSNTQDACRFFCPAGQFIADGNVCEHCPRHQYKVGTAYYRDTCDNCSVNGSVGTIGNGSTSAADCIYEICSAGQFIARGERYCSDCPYNTYQPIDDPVPHSVNCTSCQVNFGTERQGSDAASDCIEFCPSGQYLDENDECQPCAQGTYKDNNVDRFAPECTQCPAGKVTPGTGATRQANCTVTACAPGTYISGNTCPPCPVGTYNPEYYAQVCIACQSGTSTEGTNSTSAAQCNQYPGTQPYKVEELVFDIPFLDVDDAVVEAIENSVHAYLSNASLTNFVVTYRFVSVLGVTWSTEVGPHQSILVLQILADNTGFNSNANLKEDIRNDILQAMIDYRMAQTRHATLPTIDSDPVVFVQPNTICSSGTYREGTDACSPCPHASYQPTGTLEVCIPCFSGYNTTSTSSTEATDCLYMCPPGQEANSTNNGCQLCGEDENKPATVPAVNMCTACATNYHGNMDRTQCFQDSVSGQFTNASGVFPCPVGTYSTGPNMESCTPCPSSFSTISNSSTSASACRRVCPAGQQQNSVDNSTCVQCNQTNFKAMAGPGRCMPCGENKHASEDRTQCLVNAMPGQFSTTTAALDCPRDEYSDIPNQLSCTACPANTRTLGNGSNSQDDCLNQCAYGNLTRTPTCRNGGTCVPNGQDFTCQCPSRFYGEHCDERIDNTVAGIAVRYIYFRIIFVLDFFSIDVSTTRINVGLALTAWFRGNGRNVQNFFQLSVIGLRQGSTITEIRYETNATQVADLIEEQDNLDDDLNDFATQYATDANLPTAPPKDQSYEIVLSSAIVDPNRVCGNGTFRDSTGTCTPCPIGEYQPDSDFNVCRMCRGDQTTEQTGSTLASQCRSPCDLDSNYCNGHGDCVEDEEFMTSCNCDDNYIRARCSVREDPSDSGNTNLAIGLAVGLSVGALLFISIIAYCCCFAKRSGNTSKNQETFNYPMGAATPSMLGYYPSAYPAAYPSVATAFSTATFGQPMYGQPLAILPPQQEGYAFYDEQNSLGANNSFY